MIAPRVGGYIAMILIVVKILLSTPCFLVYFLLKRVVVKTKSIVSLLFGFLLAGSGFSQDTILVSGTVQSHPGAPISEVFGNWTVGSYETISVSDTLYNAAGDVVTTPYGIDYQIVTFSGYENEQCWTTNVYAGMWGSPYIGSMGSEWAGPMSPYSDALLLYPSLTGSSDLPVGAYYTAAAPLNVSVYQFGDYWLAPEPSVGLMLAGGVAFLFSLRRRSL